MALLRSSCLAPADGGGGGGWVGEGGLIPLSRLTVLFKFQRHQPYVSMMSVWKPSAIREGKSKTGYDHFSFISPSGIS